MEEQVTIEVLRFRFREAKWHRIGDQVMAYMRLVRHPDACWGDLLEALDLPGLISDDAAMVLHQRLVPSVPAGTTPVKSRQYWEQLLAERGLSVEGPCVGYQPSVSSPTVSQSRITTELDVVGVSELPIIHVPLAPAENQNERSPT
jgi:hypothetical protein